MPRRSVGTHRRITVPKLKGIKVPVFTRGPRELQAALIVTTHTDAPGPIPQGINATAPEWAVFWALMKLGKRPDFDFEFQSSAGGGKMMLGGIVADFYIKDPPGIAINVEGLHWHYGMGRDRIATALVQAAQLAGMGIKLIFIDEDMALSNPVFYVDEALHGRDHSRMTEIVR